ncbi:MAG: DUF4258 domain-containing protein [Bacteroidetes bacterium]|nr:DUF4258 domain-containing protein [Bacteroidota bacterium]
MSLIKKDSDLWRRFRLYGFGLLMGCLLVSIITKGKACQMPGTLKLEELNSQKLEFTSYADCKMKCLGIGEDDIKDMMKKGDINYGKSEVHSKPYPKYAIEGDTRDGRSVLIIVNDCDSTTKIANLIGEKETCSCD